MSDETPAQRRRTLNAQARRHYSRFREERAALGLHDSATLDDVIAEREARVCWRLLSTLASQAGNETHLAYDPDLDPYRTAST